MVRILTLVLSLSAVAAQAAPRNLDGEQISNKGKILTLPTGPDAMIGATTSATLTGKTLSGAANTFTNIDPVAAFGYTPLNKAGDTMLGSFKALGDVSAGSAAGVSGALISNTSTSSNQLVCNMAGSTEGRCAVSGLSNFTTYTNGSERTKVDSSGNFFIDNLTAGRACITTTGGQVTTSSVLSSELAFLGGSTANIQNQISALNPTNLVQRSGDTMSGNLNVPTLMVGDGDALGAELARIKKTIAGVLQLLVTNPSSSSSAATQLVLGSDASNLTCTSFANTAGASLINGCTTSNSKGLQFNSSAGGPINLSQGGIAVLKVTGSQDVVLPNLTANRVVVTSGTSALTFSPTLASEVGFLSGTTASVVSLLGGATGNIQTQVTANATGVTGLQAATVNYLTVTNRVVFALAGTTSWIVPANVSHLTVYCRPGAGGGAGSGAGGNGFTGSTGGGGGGGRGGGGGGGAQVIVAQLQVVPASTQTIVVGTGGAGGTSGAGAGGAGGDGTFSSFGTQFICQEGIGTGGAGGGGGNGGGNGTAGGAGAAGSGGGAAGASFGPFLNPPVAGGTGGAGGAQTGTNGAVGTTPVDSFPLTSGSLVVSGTHGTAGTGIGGTNGGGGAGGGGGPGSSGNWDFGGGVTAPSGGAGGNGGNGGNANNAGTAGNGTSGTACTVGVGGNGGGGAGGSGGGGSGTAGGVGVNGSSGCKGSDGLVIIEYLSH